MAGLIPMGHTFREIEMDVRALSLEIQKSLNINLLSFGRYFPEKNEGYILNTNYEFLDKRSELTDAPLPSTYLESGMYFWDEFASESFIQCARENHIHHGMWLVSQTQHCTEVFSFSLGNNPKLGFSHYLNNLEPIEKYCLFFKEKADHLISRVEENMLEIPEYLRNNETVVSPKVPLNLGTSFPTSKVILNEEKTVSLTRRENFCFNHFLLGKTAREIALLLETSTKTVETHLRNIKIKFNCSTRSELMEQVWRLGLLKSPIVTCETVN